jgi:F0F1-type ATP synthase assembly protein I
MDPESRTPHGSREPESPSSLARAGALAGLGLQFAVSTLLFLYAGQWLDRKLHSTPLCLVIGTFIGATVGFFIIYRRLMEEQRRDEHDRER